MTYTHDGMKYETLKLTHYIPTFTNPLTNMEALLKKWCEPYEVKDPGAKGMFIVDYPSVGEVGVKWMNDNVLLCELSDELVDGQFRIALDMKKQSALIKWFESHSQYSSTESATILMGIIDKIMIMLGVKSIGLQDYSWVKEAQCDLHLNHVVKYGKSWYCKYGYEYEDKEFEVKCRSFYEHLKTIRMKDVLKELKSVLKRDKYGDYIKNEAFYRWITVSSAFTRVKTKGSHVQEFLHLVATEECDNLKEIILILERIDKRVFELYPLSHYIYLVKYYS